MAKLGHAFWGRWDFGDALVTAALDGKDDADFGNYATGSLASTADARKQVIKKVIKFSVVWLYAYTRWNLRSSSTRRESTR